MIRRAPRPDNGFLMIRNEVTRDPRLSYRASGILSDLLSRPDNWQTSAERLSDARPDHEGVKAILTALRELEACGYLIRNRYKRKDGRFAWEQVVFDTPQDVSAGHTTSPSRQDGEGRAARPAPKDVSAGHTTSPSPPGGNGRSKEDLEEDQEDLEEDELSRARSARRPQDHDDDGYRATVAEINEWRAQDRALFRQHLGDKLTADGSPWKKGVWTVDQFYTAFRRASNWKNGKPIRWPGRFVDALHDVDDWLLDQGLERGEELAWAE